MKESFLHQWIMVMIGRFLVYDVSVGGSLLGGGGYGIFELNGRVRVGGNSMRWQSRSDMKGSAIGFFGFSPSASGDMERGKG